MKSPPKDAPLEKKPRERRKSGFVSRDKVEAINQFSKLDLPEKPPSPFIAACRRATFFCGLRQRFWSTV
jgi:hypothetical protein